MHPDDAGVLQPILQRCLLGLLGHNRWDIVHIGQFQCPHDERSLVPQLCSLRYHSTGSVKIPFRCVGKPGTLPYLHWEQLGFAVIRSEPPTKHQVQGIHISGKSDCLGSGHSQLSAVPVQCVSRLLDLQGQQILTTESCSSDVCLELACLFMTTCDRTDCEFNLPTCPRLKEVVETGLLGASHQVNLHHNAMHQFLWCWACVAHF